MVDWSAVAAFTGPLLAAIVGSVAWFSWIGSRREKFITDQIKMVTGRLETRIDQMEINQASITHHLEKQDDALATAMNAIARIEGRLAGPISRGNENQSLSNRNLNLLFSGRFLIC